MRNTLCYVAWSTVLSAVLIKIPLGQWHSDKFFNAKKFSFYFPASNFFFLVYFHPTLKIDEQKHLLLNSFKYCASYRIHVNVNHFFFLFILLTAYSTSLLLSLESHYWLSSTQFSCTITRFINRCFLVKINCITLFLHDRRTKSQLSCKFKENKGLKNTSLSLFCRSLLILSWVPNFPSFRSSLLARWRGGRGRGRRKWYGGILSH